VCVRVCVRVCVCVCIQGADEIDTLIMPDNDGWTPKGAKSTAKYAFWDSSELEKGNGAFIGFDSGVYINTTVHIRNKL
jgi:hypothetical protein